MPSARDTRRPGEAARRLFLALWPEESDQLKMESSTRAALQSLHPPTRPVPAGNLHVTLVFIGSVEEGRMALLRSLAERVSLQACAAQLGESAGAQRTAAVQLVFERIAYWKKADVLCALTDETSKSAQATTAAALADRLRSGLLDDGFAVDLKPFRPHVTLARKVVLNREAPSHPAHAAHSTRASDLTMAPVTWRFTQFALIDSRTDPNGALYSVLARWPLCTEPAQMPGKNLQ